MSEMVLTPEFIDHVLETLLPLDSQRAYKRACVQLAADATWGQADDAVHRDGDPANRLVWGLATGYRASYTPVERTRRSGPFSWVERWVITISQTSESTKTQKLSAEKLATLLQRDLDEVRDGINKYGPAAGRRGFF